eukprot:2205639-Prymnesium_polylepis.2
MPVHSRKNRCARHRCSPGGPRISSGYQSPGLSPKLRRPRLTATRKGRGAQATRQTSMAACRTRN